MLSDPHAPIPKRRPDESSDVPLPALEGHLVYLAQIPEQDKMTRQVTVAGVAFTVTLFRDFPLKVDDPDSPRPLGAIVHELDIVHQAPKLDTPYQKFLDEVKTVIKDDLGFYFDSDGIFTPAQLEETLKDNRAPAHAFDKICEHFLHDLTLAKCDGKMREPGITY